MTTAYYDADDYYILKSGSNAIKILVQISEVMDGGYLIFNGPRLISANDPAMIESEQTIDEWITITVTVKNPSMQANWSSVMVTLQEDNQIPKAFGPYRREMGDRLNTVNYTIRIKLIQ